MKSKGIVRNLDPLGRIVIPMEMRKGLHIKEGDPMEILVNGSSVILKKHSPNCVICNSDKGVIEFEDKLICKSCISKIANINIKE